MIGGSPALRLLARRKFQGFLRKQARRLKTPSGALLALVGLAAISLWLGTSGKLDRVPTDDVLRFENEFLDFLRRSHADLLDGIRESLKFEDGAAAKAESAYEKFLDQFETSDGQSIKVGHEAPAEALADDELEQETIVKQKRG